MVRAEEEHDNACLAEEAQSAYDLVKFVLRRIQRHLQGELTLILLKYASIYNEGMSVMLIIYGRHVPLLSGDGPDSNSSMEPRAR